MPRWLKTLAIILILLGLIILYLFIPERDNLAHLASAGDPYNAEILRDSYGVPHIFGHTDADAAYGLAYAHAEDDFPHYPTSAHRRSWQPSDYLWSRCGTK